MRFGRWFGAARPRREPAAVGEVKRWVLAALGAGPETAVTVSEIACLDPGCPGTETVILIMAPGRKTRAAKIAKPLGEVTPEDVSAAVADDAPALPERPRA
jgi:hypothetical protein